MPKFLSTAVPTSLRLLLFALLPLAVMSGCRTADPMALTESLQRQVVIHDEELAENIRVFSLEPVSVEGTTTVQFNVLNLTGKPFTVVYRLEWFDPNGYLLEEVADRQLTLRPEDFTYIQHTLVNPLVARTRLVLRPYEREERRPVP